jgi:shikimate dehydrogenase
MRLFGLIGYPLAQSFSKKYFTEKFSTENIADASYELFELKNIAAFADLLHTHKNLFGINVTIPYKEEVIRFLTETDEEAQKIGAVNCIKISGNELKGFNTDAPAFEQSLKTLLRPHHRKALILGSGGAAKAVAYVLQKLGIDFTHVSRSKKNNHFTYEALTSQIINEHKLIVNCTPVGSFPKIDTAPPILYEYLSPEHYLYDLVYNPFVTKFLSEGQRRGTAIKNGYEMLELQAELSWKIWKDS